MQKRFPPHHVDGEGYSTSQADGQASAACKIHIKSKKYIQYNTVVRKELKDHKSRITIEHIT